MNEIQKEMQIESKDYKQNKMSVKRIKGEKKLSFYMFFCMFVSFLKKDFNL